jgi:cytochrome c551/c552
MNRTATLIAAGLLAATFQTTAYSQDKGEAAAKPCMGCHAVDAKKAGPSFKDVAAKNKGANADKLIAGMKAKAMHAGVMKSTKEDDLKAVATWILSLS